jgi:ABC-2 type transport system ATP-binding protein
MTQSTAGVEGIRLRGLRKAYGKNEVLRGIDAEFAPARVTALVGANGAGKTTLLRIIAALLRPDSGEVIAPASLYYGGFDVLPVAGAINDLRRSLGLRPVEGGKRQLSQLSRGELQIAGLDIAFELAPAGLLLDEPWTALEPDARDALTARIIEASRSRTIICSSHDLDEVARVAHDVAFIGNGVVAIENGGAVSGAFERERLVRRYREVSRR